MAKRYPTGSAIEFLYTASGYTVNTLWMALYNGSDTLVKSATATASGGGFYFAIVTMPSSPGNYVGIWNAYYGSDFEGDPALWKQADRVELIVEEVD